MSACTGTVKPAPTSAGSSPPGTEPAHVWIVALGDSVPAGTACECTPYPQLSATDLSVPAERTVLAANDAVAGYTTTDVIGQLAGDMNTVEDVQRADIVEIEIGANDVPYTDTCGTDLNCYLPDIPAIGSNLRSIVSRVHELLAGHRALIVLLDYWSVWLGGQFAQQKGMDYVDAAAAVTHEVDAAITAVAGETDSIYVDLRAAFKGPSYAYDETHYLASDGDHPNAAGHRQIASALYAAVQEHMHLPPS